MDSHRAHKSIIPRGTSKRQCALCSFTEPEKFAGKVARVFFCSIFYTTNTYICYYCSQFLHLTEQATGRMLFSSHWLLRLTVTQGSYIISKSKMLSHSRDTNSAHVHENPMYPPAFTTRLTSRLFPLFDPTFSGFCSSITSISFKRPFMDVDTTYHI